VSKTGRPKLHSAKRRSISISLTDDELREATDGNDWQRTIAEQVSDCARIGAAARARDQRIGDQGFELGATENGIEVLFRASAPRAALAIKQLIDTFERMMMHNDNTDTDDTDTDMPEHNWSAALSEMRRFLQKNGERQCVFLDDENRAALIEFLTEPSENN